LNIDSDLSAYHRQRIDQGLLDKKPGWVRITFNELNSSAEVEAVLTAVADIARDWIHLSQGYTQNPLSGEFRFHTMCCDTVGIDGWAGLADGNIAGFSPAIERFLRLEILPRAANTHTEISYTGTVCTQWYHWAQEQIRAALGAGPRHVLKFVRAGYDPLYVLAYYLGTALPGVLNRRYKLSEIIKSWRAPRFLFLGQAQPDLADGILAVPQACPDEQTLIRAADSVRPGDLAFVGFDPTVQPRDPCGLSARLHRKGLLVIADAIQWLGKLEVSLAGACIDGCLVRTEQLPGGWQSHPALLLREDLFGNGLPLDVGGGVVHWTTEHLQRYVSDRSALEDAGTPGIIQAIRAGLVIGRAVRGIS